MAVSPRRPLGPAVQRGIAQRCPACGEGKLFRKYLKVHDRCPACAHDLEQYPADDGPAYLTILIAGHLIVAPLLFFPFMWESSPWIVLPATLIPLTIATLLLLPYVKGGVLGLLYAFGIHRGDAHWHTADRPD